MDLAILIQNYGALGIVAFIIWWLTQKISKEINHLSDEIKKLSEKVDKFNIIISLMNKKIGV